MKHLTLIRHAKSDWHSPVGSDFDRPLNGRGKKAAVTMGQRLAASDFCPGLLLCSPAKRARQTAKRIAAEIDYPREQIHFAEEIYAASLLTLVELLHNLAGENEEVILIGHNPGLSELGQWLDSSAPDWLPTCGLLKLELPIDRWATVEENAARLLEYDYPKKG